MGIPDESFWAPQELVVAIRKNAATRGAELSSSYDADIASMSESYLWDAAWNTPKSSSFSSLLPSFDESASFATRQIIQKVLDASLPALPGLISGSADLTGNTGTKLSKQTAQSAKAPDGRQVYFGIREHAMGAALVGMALHGGVLPVAGTFLCSQTICAPQFALQQFRAPNASSFFLTIQLVSEKMGRPISQSNNLPRFGPSLVCKLFVPQIQMRRLPRGVLLLIMMGRPRLFFLDKMCKASRMVLQFKMVQESCVIVRVRQQ